MLASKNIISILKPPKISNSKNINFEKKCSTLKLRSFKPCLFQVRKKEDISDVRIQINGFCDFGFGFLTQTQISKPKPRIFRFCAYMNHTFILNFDEFPKLRPLKH